MAGGALRRTVALVVMVALAAGGCGNSTKPSGPAGTGTAASGQPAGKTPTPKPNGSQAAVPNASSIEQAVYFLEKDSTGTTPGKDTTIGLLFEPGGRTVFLASSPSDALGYHGTWRYEGGKLSLKFTSPDFNPDATFDLNLNDTTVTMPFAVFENVKGTSTWKRGSLSLLTKATVIFAADGADPDSGVTPDGAVDEAVAVGQSMIGSQDPHDVLPLADRPDGVPLARVIRGGVDLVPAYEPAGPNVKDVSRSGSSLHVEYDDRPAVDVALFDFTADPPAPGKLTPGPVASDPRVRLDPEPSGHSDDPKNRKAAFIEPFTKTRFHGGLWTTLLPNGAVKWLGGNPGAIGQFAGEFDREGARKALEKRGYEVTTVVDDDATLTNIVDALGGVSGPAPGLVIFSTHGSQRGGLLTGDDLGNWSDWDGVDAAWAKVREEAKKISPDLLTFEGGTEEAPKTFELLGMAYEKSTNPFNSGDFFVNLTPAFWRWLASHNGGFHDSLVFIGACSTDATPDLRDAVQAKAYFAWASPANSVVDAAVMEYMIDSLVRPTHTAEEAYYNIIRVFATGQRIYDEDSDLAPAFDQAFSKGQAFLGLFHGYGWNGSEMVPYMTSGWLDRKMNPGNVWWLVFTGRWDKKAGDGAYALVQCWDNYWHDPANRPGLRDAFCNAASPGGAPSADEVGYATFVLTGKQAKPYSGKPVPRFTLADLLN